MGCRSGSGVETITTCEAGLRIVRRRDRACPVSTGKEILLQREDGFNPSLSDIQIASACR